MTLLRYELAGPSTDSYVMDLRLILLVLGGNENDGDQVEEDADAAGADGGLGGAGGEIEDVVGLQDGVGLLALHDFFEVDGDERALTIDGADDAEIAGMAVEEGAAAERGGFEQGQGGVL